MPDIIHARGIDDKVYATFKAIVISKHGKINGVLGDEITEALQEYIEKNREVLVESTQTAVKRKSPESKDMDRKPEGEYPPSYFGSDFDGSDSDSAGGFPYGMYGSANIGQGQSDLPLYGPGDLPRNSEIYPVQNVKNARVEFDNKRGLPLAKANRSPTMEKANAVINQLKECEIWAECENFPKPVVQRFIREMIGGDGRTIKKYTALIENKWVLCEEA
jgi:hypothetical protein